MEENFNEYQNWKTNKTASTRLHRANSVRGPKAQPRQSTQRNFNQADNDLDEETTATPSQADIIKAQIEDIDKQITRHGGMQSCGWDPADHKEFLRIKTKHNDRLKTIAFLKDMQGAVPTESETSVRQHVEIYQKLIGLQEDKKKLMKDYREAKRKKPMMADSDLEKLDKQLGLNADLEVPTKKVRHSS